MVAYYEGKRIKPKQLEKIYLKQGLCLHGGIPGQCNRCKKPVKTRGGSKRYGKTIFQQSDQWKQDAYERSGSLGKSRPIYNKKAWLEENKTRLENELERENDQALRRFFVEIDK